MRETAKAILYGGYSGICLENPAMKFVAKIIERASELVAAAEKVNYWEVERNPKGIYTHPG